MAATCGRSQPPIGTSAQSELALTGLVRADRFWLDRLADLARGSLEAVKH